MTKTLNFIPTRLGMLAFAAACFSPLAMAQSPMMLPQPPHIVVSGSGTASAPPDQAEIEIGVVTQAKEAAEASRQNAQQLDAVLQAVRKLLPKDGEIKTAQLSVQPNYQYQEGKSPLISDYTATNTLRIKTADLEGVSAIIDNSMKAGANNVQSLRFSVKDEDGLQAQALAEAVADAQAQADVIAKALKLPVLRVLSVQAGGSSPPIIYAERAMMMKSSDQAATPVEPGTIDVQTSVTLTVEIGGANASGN